jgi:transposase
MQKHKLNHDLEVLKPPPEREARAEKPSPWQQSLTQLHTRRRTLEDNITDLRTRIIGYADKSYAQYREDTLKALEDAREEQKELVLEETGLLEMMQETGEKDHKRVDLTPDHERDLEGEAFDEQLREAKQ